MNTIQITQNTWGKGKRDDLILFEFALSFGFTAWTKNKPVAGIPYDSLSYNKGNKWIWFCQKGWACAEIIDGYFRNHRYYSSLVDALEKEA